MLRFGLEKKVGYAEREKELAMQRPLFLKFSFKCMTP